MNETQPFAFLNGGGKMGELVRNKDWSATAIGDPSTWPASLRTTVNLLLHSQFPMFVWWGKDLSVIYNDAYIQIAGEKHPSLLGKSGKEGWSEIWPDLAPLVESVFNGVSTWSEDQVLYMNRRGYVEETYFTFSYSPVIDESGEVGGLFCACIETTDKVLAARKIEESEKNLRNTILQAPVAMCILRGDTYVVEVANERMFQLWGRGAQDVLGRSIFAGLPEVSNQGLEELLHHVSTTGETVSQKERSLQLPRNSALETVIVNFVYEPLREADGSIAGVIAVATDVTEQVLARQQVEESEQRVSAVVESAPFPIGVYVGREMVIELANQSIIDIWGKGPDVIGRRYAEVLPELENQLVFSQLDSVFTTGIPFHARNQRIDLVVNGTLKPYFFNYSFTPLFDSNGKVYGVMNTAADVTDLYHSKQKVEQSERNFRSMILQAPVAMCILLGPEHVVDIANDAMIALWGKPAEQVMYKPIFEGLPDATEQGLEALLDAVYETGIPFKGNEHPVQLMRQGKMETVFQNFAYEPYKDADGNTLGVLAISIDVTEQVQARQKIEEIVVMRTRELAQANDALVKSNEELIRTNTNLEDFAYAASHDMKEPIRKIQFYSSQLKSELEATLTEKQSRLFERVERSSSRMATLIDDLLSYSQATKGAAEQEEIDLNKKMEIVLHDLELEVEQKNALIQVDALPIVRGNRRQFQQLFQNLVSNALKYSKTDTPPQVKITSKTVHGKEVNFALSVDQENNQYHLIEIRDNGIGFNQEDAERIFNVFTRLHANIDQKGTGVGLSIVRKVVENHDGYVWAESKPDEGATFKILLPVSE